MAEIEKDRPGQDGQRTRRVYGDTITNNVARDGQSIKPTDAEQEFFDAPSHGTAADLFLEKFGATTVFDMQSQDVWRLAENGDYRPFFDARQKLREILEEGLKRVKRYRQYEGKSAERTYRFYDTALQKSGSMGFLRQSVRLAAESLPHRRFPRG